MAESKPRLLFTLASETVPSPFRKLYSTFADEAIASSNVTDLLKSVLILETKMDFYHQYEACRELLNKEDEELIAFLIKQGIQTPRGVSWVSCLNAQ